jgi:hypothetical protein
MPTPEQKTTELPKTSPAGELEAEQLGEDDLKTVTGGMGSPGGVADTGVCVNSY